MPAKHRLCTGLIGMHGTVASNKAVQKADLLAAIGARFSDRVISRADLFARNAKILHLDIDPAEINKNMKAHFALIGNVKDTLKALLEKLPLPVETEWNGEIEKWKARLPGTGGREGKKHGLHPRFVIEETARRAGPGAIVVTDVGQHQMWTAQFYPVERPRSFLSSGGLGAMGYGLGAAVGAGAANPGRRVVLLTGAGSFRMNSGEMATIAACRIPALIILFNNGSLGMVRQWQSFFCEGRYSATDLPALPDFVKLAEAYGFPAYRAADEASFKAALEKALAGLGAPEHPGALVEALISPDEKVLPMVPSGRPIDEQIL
jgi:acetolactate synthase-1/2/3 large subunit